MLCGSWGGEGALGRISGVAGVPRYQTEIQGRAAVLGGRAELRVDDPLVISGSGLQCTDRRLRRHDTIRYVIWSADEQGIERTSRRSHP